MHPQALRGVVVAVNHKVCMHAIGMVFVLDNDGSGVTGRFIFSAVYYYFQPIRRVGLTPSCLHGCVVFVCVALLQFSLEVVCGND